MSKMRLALVMMVCAFVVMPAGSVFSQETATAPAAGKNAQELWDDFVHFVKVAQPDVASSYATQLLESGASDKVIYELSQQTEGLEGLLRRAEGMEGMKEVVARLRKTIEGGYEAKRADPEEITESIKLLTGTIRSFERGAKRLKVSGEYALPQLIQKLIDPTTAPLLKERIIIVLPRLGKEAVRGLSAALQTENDELQRIIVDTLGEIGYPHAAPRLKELATRKGVIQSNQKAAISALVACVGKVVAKKSTSELFYDSALKYYYNAESLMPDERYPTANVWYWKENLGLVYKKVPREIFDEIYAMRMSRLALKHDPDLHHAVSLWIAANLRKEADLPEGKEDPTKPEDMPGADYFALAGGVRYQQAVLKRAMKDDQIPVAIGAIQALAQTTGAENMVKPMVGGGQPLVSALTYANRKVRYLAAQSLAEALPGEKFTNSHVVIMVLIEAIRQTGQKKALVVAEDPNILNKYKDNLRGLKYEVLEARTPDGAVKAISRSQGVDAVLIAAEPSPIKTVNAIRSEPGFSTIPIVVAAEESMRLKELSQSDKSMALVRPEPPVGVMEEGINKAKKLAAGVVFSEEKQVEWAVKAAKAIRLLGLTGNRVYDITRATEALNKALKHKDSSLNVAAAQALAAIQTAEAQQAIVSLAVGDRASDEVRISAFEALSESLRRFGNHLTDEQRTTILDVVKGDGAKPLRNAAAQALGAMNLSSEKIESLILEAKEAD